MRGEGPVLGVLSAGKGEIQWPSLGTSRAHACPSPFLTWLCCLRGQPSPGLLPHPSLSYSLHT